MKFIYKLKGKKIVVFGATSGIGYAIAEGALEHGADVVVVGSNQDRLENTVSKLRETYPSGEFGTITTGVADLSDADKLDENIRSLLDKIAGSGTGKINHIAFTAGDSLSLQPLGELTIPEIMKAQTVRLLAPLMIAKHAKEYMEDSPDSSFTFTGGQATDKPPPGWLMPCVFGGAIAAMARGLAVDLAPIRANCVEPGAVATPLLMKFLTPESEREFVDATLVGRLGRPEDAAEGYLYPMRDGFVTGSVIKTNGGRFISSSDIYMVREK